MPKQKTKKPSSKTAPSETIPFDLLAGWRWLGVLALLTLIFFWNPLTNAETTPQWDAIDVHYSSQKYFADHILEGVLPFWTPYIFSGFPFLADPQVGAWYPLNWPFFLIGITAKTIEAEIALHTLLACAGMYLLLLRYTTLRPAAIAGALFFSFSGYFADHTQHVGLYCGACWLPWLALFLLLAIDRAFLRWTAAGGLAAGSMILAGGFQAALYGFFAVALFGVGVAILERKAILRILGFLGGAAMLGAMLSAIMSLPGLELTAQSARASASYGSATGQILRLKDLIKLWWPNPTGASGAQQPDTAYHLYSGFLLLPLAALGVRNPRMRVMGLVVAIPSIWYMLGPAFGLYQLGEFLPGLHKVRAPIHAWFVAIFGLSILAANGAEWLFDQQRKRRWFAAALVCFIFGDLFYWNGVANPGIYSRYSWDERYGNFEENTRQKVLATLPSGTRFDAPDRLTAFGPLNHPLDLHLEATYGYNPLMLTYYGEYRSAAEKNPKLLSAMNVARRLDVKLGSIVPAEKTLARAYFARSVESIPDDATSRERLTTIDPESTTILNGPEKPSIDSRAAIVSVTSGEQELRVRYKSTSPGLVRVAIPFFPGWRASVDGVAHRVLRVDHAFVGVEAPAGEKELLLRFHSTYFGLGLALSAVALAGGMAMLALKGERRKAATPDRVAPAKGE